MDSWMCPHPIFRVKIARLCRCPFRFCSGTYSHADPTKFIKSCYKILALKKREKVHATWTILTVSTSLINADIQANIPEYLYFFISIISDEGLTTGLGLKIIFVRSWSWSRWSWSRWSWS